MNDRWLLRTPAEQTGIGQMAPAYKLVGLNVYNSGHSSNNLNEIYLLIIILEQGHS